MRTEDIDHLASSGCSTCREIANRELEEQVACMGRAVRGPVGQIPLPTDRVAITTDSKPLSVFQWFVLNVSNGTAVQYPKRCAICGQKTKGNRLFGYRLTCEHGVDR